MSKIETLTRDVRVELANLTNTKPEDWFFVFRARYGIEVVLRVLKEQRGGGEVITQPFTCVTAVNPILSAGHIPLYADASYDDFSLDTSKLQASAETRALIMQHTFSLESNLAQAAVFAREHNLLLVEDSAHHVGMMAQKDGRALADISVHSFGVEKLLPAKFGGAVWVNPDMKNTALRDGIRAALQDLPTIGQKQAGLVRRYRFFNHILNTTPTFIEPALRSLVIHTGLFQPAIMPDELHGKNHDAPAQPNAFVLDGMSHSLKRYKEVVKKRAAASAVYSKNLADTGMLPKVLPERYSPARFPLLCHDAAQAVRLFDALRRAGHYSGKWYRPTLFPGPADPAKYNYDPELYPVAEDIAARIVNLPTNITTAEAKEIADVVRREAN